MFHVKQRPTALADFDPATEARLARFADLLATWNARINLVADCDAAAIQTRHIADSAQLAPLLPATAGPIADLGSGGGLPGIVLAIIVRQPFHLVESDRRKCAFLVEACSQLGVHHVQIHPMRIEETILPPLAAVTARALAPLSTLLGHAARLLAPGGIAIFPKGRSAEAEIAEAHRHWSFDIERTASCTDPEAVILRVSRLSPRPGTTATRRRASP